MQLAGITLLHGDTCTTTASPQHYHPHLFLLPAHALNCCLVQQQFRVCGVSGFFLFSRTSIWSTNKLLQAKGRFAVWAHMVMAPSDMESACPRQPFRHWMTYTQKTIEHMRGREWGYKVQGRWFSLSVFFIHLALYYSRSQSVSTL